MPAAMQQRDQDDMKAPWKLMGVVSALPIKDSCNPFAACKPRQPDRAWQTHQLLSAQPPGAFGALVIWSKSNNLQAQSRKSSLLW